MMNGTLEIGRLGTPLLNTIGYNRLAIQADIRSQNRFSCWVKA